MKIRRIALTVSLAMLAVPVGSQAGIAGPDAPAQGITSTWVEHVKFVPFEVYGATSARLVGNYFYISSLRSISIYDVTNPEDPQLMSVTPVPSQWENEDLATNGKILVYSQTGNVPLVGVGQNQLHIYDVTDKAAPVKLATLAGAGQHTMTCIADCTYLYGSSGNIIDLRNPAAPAIVGNWASKAGVPSAHDVREVAPGIVSVSNSQGSILDTTDPLNPVKLSTIVGTKPPGLIHSTAWANEAEDRIMLMANETNLTGRCGTSNGATSTWDMSDWRSGDYTMLDKMQAKNGFLFDGNAPANVGGCSAHWVEASPSFENGGIFAQGYYDHGARFFYANGAGKITDVGFYQQPYGWTSAAYWVTDRIVYAVDYIRGFDILRWNGPLPQNPAATTSVSDIAATVGGSVSGTATFAGESASTVLATDPAGDAAVAPDPGNAAGADLIEASVRQPESSLPYLEFQWKVNNLPGADTAPNALPEGVRYVWSFMANGKQYLVQAKLSNFSSTTVPDDPQGHATHAGRAFQLRGNCGPGPGGVSNSCAHLAWLDGKFDFVNKTVTVRVPLGLANAPDIKPGAVLSALTGTSPSIYASFQAVVTQFSPVNMADSGEWLAENPYTIPKPAVSLGVAPAGTDPSAVTYNVPATLAADGSFTGSVGSVPAGSEVFAKSCFGTSCATGSVAVS